MPAKATNVYARYENIRYNVKYYDDKGNLIRTTTPLYNSNVIAGPPKTGYAFAGWYTAKSGGTKIAKITANRNLHARYTIKQYTVKYYDGSKLLSSAKRNFNSTLPSGPAPTKAGKKFIGWFDKASGGTQTKKVPAKNVNVYARYENIKYTTKYYNGNTLVSTKVNTYNAGVIAGPKKAGYTFVGWYTAKSGGTKVTKVTANRTLYARFMLNSQYATSVWVATKSGTKFHRVKTCNGLNTASAVSMISKSRTPNATWNGRTFTPCSLCW